MTIWLQQLLERKLQMLICVSPDKFSNVNESIGALLAELIY